MKKPSFSASCMSRLQKQKAPPVLPTRLRSGDSKALAGVILSDDDYYDSLLEAVGRHASTIAGALHVRVVGSAAAFRRDPDDVLGRVLDVAGLAVHAVLRVDLQPRAGRIAHDLVDAGRAIALLGRVVELEIHADRNRRVL